MFLFTFCTASQAFWNQGYISEAFVKNNCTVTFEITKNGLHNDFLYYVMAIVQASVMDSYIFEEMHMSLAYRVLWRKLDVAHPVLLMHTQSLFRLH